MCNQAITGQCAIRLSEFLLFRFTGQSKAAVELAKKDDVSCIQHEREDAAEETPDAAEETPDNKAETGTGEVLEE